MRLKILCFFVLLSLTWGAGQADDLLKIYPVKDEMKRYFVKRIEVFGLQVFATQSCPNDKMRHAASVLAEYLDNNEDGLADNPIVLERMKKQRAAMVLTGTEREAERLFDQIPDAILSRRALQALYGEEIHPGNQGPFDATLEEVLHLVTFAGYSEAYPKVFGLKAGSELTKAMDIARGGRFRRVPRNYPPQAWYSYDDRSCDYQCMAVEYFYWGLTSVLGAQESKGRFNHIRQEWRLNTLEKMKSTDTTLYALLTDPRFKLPTICPDGKYREAAKK